MKPKFNFKSRQIRKSNQKSIHFQSNLKLKVIQGNQALQLALTKGAGFKMIMEQWDFVQAQVSQYINGELPGG